MMTRRRSTPSCAKIACCASPDRPAAQVWVEIGTPVAFWARAEARSTVSITGVTPAVSRSKRWGQFSCTPGERVTMCSCISVGPSSAVATGPSAVSTIVPVLWSSVAIRRAVLEGGDELALDGIDRQPEALEGDEHLRGVAFGDLALDRQ